MNWLKLLAAFPVFSNITSPPSIVANMSDTTAINQEFFK